MKWLRHFRDGMEPTTSELDVSQMMHLMTNCKLRGKSVPVVSYLLRDGSYLYLLFIGKSKKANQGHITEDVDANAAPA